MKMKEGRELQTAMIRKGLKYRVFYAFFILKMRAGMMRALEYAFHFGSHF